MAASLQIPCIHENKPVDMGTRETEEKRGEEARQKETERETEKQTK